jgi:hypothetical protein
LKRNTLCGNRYVIENCDNDEICNQGECISRECADECELNDKLCSAYNKIKVCTQTECGKKLIENECPQNQGCKNGECIENYCSDECNPNEENCELWDMSSNTFINTNQEENLYDRAQEYLRWLYKYNMFFGGVAEAIFDNENLENLSDYNGVGDSAIWTGTYLAAESFRYMATGSYASYKNIKKLINTLHLWFNVSGYDGLLVRYAAETEKLNNSDKPTEDMLNCSRNRIYCNIEYQGKLYNYKGHISRDQYQGVLLGYSLAYSALGNTKEEKELKNMIRDDIVELTEQLMKITTFKVKYEIYDDRIPPYLGGSPITGEKTISARYVVLSPKEFDENGNVVVKFCSPGHSPENCETNFWGMQEFMPDLKPFLNQLTNLLTFIPYIPRSGSAIMLSNIFNIAIQVTENTQGYEEKYQEFKNFYYSNNDEWKNVNSWLDSAEQWEYLNKCGEKYYGINITMEPLYNLLRLEKNNNIRNRILNNVLKSKIWEEIKNHKNSFFSYIYLSALENTEQEVLDSANNQFKDFPVTPKRHFALDLTNTEDYPQYSSREDGCQNQVNHDTAVDVKDRKMSDFIWQRNPWELFSPPELRRIYPGVDYLIVYWMGQYYNFLQDYGKNRCFRYRER